MIRQQKAVGKVVGKEIFLGIRLGIRGKMASNNLNKNDSINIYVNPPPPFLCITLLNGMRIRGQISNLPLRNEDDDGTLFREGRIDRQ